MRRLPCQKSDTFLQWTWQSLWWPRTKIQMKCQNIQPFLLKSGNSTNDHPKYNDPNAKLKSLYNEAKDLWILKYGTTKFYLSTWTPYWWKHGTPSRCNIETPSGTYLLKNIYPPHPSWLNNKYRGMCCLHPSILCNQGWINQQNITIHSFTHWGTRSQDRLYYGCPLRKSKSAIIKEHCPNSCSVLFCDETNRHPYSRHE